MATENPPTSQRMRFRILPWGGDWWSSETRKTAMGHRVEHVGSLEWSLPWHLPRCRWSVRRWWNPLLPGLKCTVQKGQSSRRESQYGRAVRGQPATAPPVCKTTRQECINSVSIHRLIDWLTDLLTHHTFIYISAEIKATIFTKKSKIKKIDWLIDWLHFLLYTGEKEASFENLQAKSDNLLGIQGPVIPSFDCLIDWKIRDSPHFYFCWDLDNHFHKVNEKFRDPTEWMDFLFQFY